MVESSATSNFDVYRARIRTLIVVVLLFGVTILARLFDRTVLANGLAEVKALAQQEVEVKLNPFRGNIFVHGSNANENSALALNEPKAKVDIIPRNVKDKKNTAAVLAPILEIAETELFNKINNEKLYLPTIKRNLPLEIGNKIDALKLVGVEVSTEAVRVYPEGSLAAHVLGFVNSEGGQYGVEGYYDNQLQGFVGNVQGQRDGWGNMFLDRSNVTNNKGSDIVLTIDRDIQVIVEQKLKTAMEKFQAKSGSVVIVEPSSGKVIAMANMPTFDPNSYNSIKPEDQGNFRNIAIMRTFEPGSVMKSVTVASALDAGKVKRDEKGTYGSSVRVDNEEINTAENKAFGVETPFEVLANSDNVAMVDYSARLGRELMYDTMTRFNFGKKTGVDLDTEGTGTMPPLKDWRAINVATVSFGQGITVTPLQMVMSYAAMANNGSYVPPHVVEKIIFPDGRFEEIKPKPGRRVVSEQASKDITEMLVNVVVKGHGKRAGVKGYDVAGKTGTAQIANTDGGGYQDGKNNGTFVGYAPAYDPKFAMIVTFEEPQGVEFAESSAAPVFGEIADYLLKKHYRMPPKEQAAN